MKLLILAGGYGTRLYPLIKDIPKALLEVAGKTLIDHTLDKFIGIQAIDEVLVVTNAKFYDVLCRWAEKRNGNPFPVRVINDGTTAPENRLGAIGDILFVLDKIGMGDDIAVVGSDNLFSFAINDFFVSAAAKAPAVSVGAYDLGDISGAGQYGVLEVDAAGRILSLEEKPKNPRSSLISMCLYYIPVKALPFFKAFIDETGRADTTGGFIQWLYQKTPVYGFKFSGEWYDIGSLESYNEAQKHFVA